MKKIRIFGALLSLLLAMTISSAAAGLLDYNQPYRISAVWQRTGRASVSNAVAGLPAEFETFRLDSAGLASVLADAPHESEVALRDSESIIPLPMPDGTIDNFRVHEAPVLMPELAARFPEIKTYRIVSLKDGSVTGRFDVSPYGFHATISGGENGTVAILPADPSNPTLYASFRGTSPDSDEVREMCGTFQREGRIESEIESKTTSNIALGPQLRTYRIAISATWEYANAFGNGTVAGTVASIATWLNGVNVYFERDVAVRMLLVNNTNIIFSADRGFTAATDPFDNDSTQSELLNQNAVTQRDIVGIANYNLGHVLAFAANGGNGVAALNSVCNDRVFVAGPVKGEGYTRVGTPAGNPVSLSIMTHEIAHQFGANHTHNAGGCAERIPENGYEAGGGMTIMAYRNACGVNSYGPPFDAPLFFHSRSIQQITDHIVNGLGATCSVLVNSGNSAPQVTAPTVVNIPKQTPFALTATANDPDAADNNNLTYTWEQYDAGGQYSNPSFSDAGDPATTTRPIFRSFPMTRNPTRTFPSLEYILNNANEPPDVITLTGPFIVRERRSAEKLPQVQRTLNFRVTVRDNVGGTNDANTVLNVDGNSGPFRVTSPNTAATIPGGSQQNVTWDVANTQNAPVSAANVRITLSTDGGNTFPTVLAASVPNSGTATVTIPNGVATTTARIKVEAVGNIFFDISDANFTITLGGNCPVVTAVNPVVTAVGQPVVLTGLNFTGVTAVRFSGNVNSTFTINNDGQITATVPNGATAGPVSIVKPGCNDAASPAVTICAGANVTLQVDGPGGEISVSGGVTSSQVSRFVVNRLTPASYPATLTAITVVFPSANDMPAGTEISLLSGNATAPDTVNGVPLRSTPATLPTNRNAPVTMTVPPLTITSGDFVVGYRYTIPPNANIRGVLAETGTSQQRSFTSLGGETFTRYIFNYRIRAEIQGNCLTTTACALNLGATTQNFAAAGGNGNFNFTTSANDCPWTVNRTASWISITSAPNGTGGSTVSFTVAPNNTPTARTGTITVGDKTFTVTQDAGTAPTCNFAIAPASANVAATASTGNNVAVTAPTGCGWQAVTAVNWINVTAGATGSGNGTVTFSVAANTDDLPRTGAIIIGGQTFTVTQAGSLPVCNYAIAPAEANVGAAGATGLTVNMTVANQCIWTAETTDNWITVTGGATGNGNGTVTFSVAANPSPTDTRTGTIVIGRQNFRVIQAPAAQNCNYAINPGNAILQSVASTGNTFAVATNNGCAWTATSNAPWLTVTGGNGTGNGTVTYSADANPSAANARVGTITVNGQTFTVAQASADPQCLPVTGGLVNWYRGELNPFDSIGANTADNIGNVAFAPNGRVGNFIIFDGASNLSIQRRIANDLSIEFWMRTANAGGASETDWTQGAGLVANDEFGVSLGNGKVMFGVGAATIASDNTVSDSQWHHVVATRERASGALRLFIDGVAQAQSVNAGTQSLTAGAQLLIGRRGTGAFYTGDLDEVKIFDTNLRDEQVTAEFNGCGAAPRINVNDTRTPEGDPNPNGEFLSAGFTVTLTAPATQDVTVYYSTEDDTAIDGIDYVGDSGALTIPAGQTSGTIIVPIISDDGDEADKRFILVLQTADGATISDSEGFATIIDDDSACDFDLDEEEVAFSSSGGSSSVFVDGSGGCGWSAVSLAPWITISGGASGNGDGTVNFSVAPNSGALRTGTIVVAGQSLTITQDAPLAPSVTIAGRVNDGKSAVANATVTLTGVGGPRTVKTNTFGFYSFTDVPTGQTVIVSAKAKGYAFTPRTLNVTSAVSDFDLITAPN